MQASARAWLEIQCRAIPGIARGVVLLGLEAAGEAKLAASWPSSAPTPQELIGAARAALEVDRVIVDSQARPGAGDEAEGKGHAHIAVPLALGGRGVGAVAVELTSSGRSPPSS